MGGGEEDRWRPSLAQKQRETGKIPEHREDMRHPASSAMDGGWGERVVEVGVERGWSTSLHGECHFTIKPFYFGIIKSPREELLKESTAHTRT